MPNPRYPIFIPTKGRADTRKTARALDQMGVPYTEVIEEDDEKAYREAGAKNLVIQPQHDRGLVQARNNVWDHAQSIGTPKYWTMDDNICRFYRFNRNSFIKMRTGAGLRAIEDFVGRYSNVPIAGMQYFMFIVRREKLAPFWVNHRVYSNMLVDTFAKDPRGKPYRFEGFYNDDTDICLRILKDGLCTILFNAFMVHKSNTMTVRGGMTPHYIGDGRWKMAEELRRKHPEITKITWKWGRWQHHVDYRRFRKNLLIRRKDVEIPKGVNEYGMELKSREANH